MLPRHARVVARLLERLPGVGERTAARYVLHLLSSEPALTTALARALEELHVRVRPCERCGNLAEVDPERVESPILCDICADPRRDGSLLCVVARVQDLSAIERSGAMRGRYFVLGKLVSPLEGVGPDDLPLERLRARIVEEGVREVIVATPPSVDGEATALLLARELAQTGAQVSRIASGVPHGSDLEFADQVTLGRAIAGRRTGGA
ncbi:MAG: recombination protein RecR [Deltaproteobacteria bacterium]|nr:recombination protein RecR [Deltaproteobacteria bacterium]